MHPAADDTHWYCVETAKHIVEILQPPYSPTILFFCTKFGWYHPQRGPRIQEGIYENCVIFGRCISKKIKDGGIVTMID